MADPYAPTLQANEMERQAMARRLQIAMQQQPAAQMPAQQQMTVDPNMPAVPAMNFMPAGLESMAMQKARGGAAPSAGPGLAERLMDKAGGWFGGMGAMK